jgi:acyl carrier protein
MVTAVKNTDLETVKAVIGDLIAEVAGVPRERVTPDTSLEALGIDSLLIVEVVMGIQRKFGVQVPPSQFRSDIRTVEQVCDILGAYVFTRMNGGEAPKEPAAGLVLASPALGSGT